MMPLTRSSLLWTTVASLLAVSALLGMGGPQRAQAQTQETTITIENFFVRHRSELQPGAVVKLQAALEQARKCPSDVTVEFLSRVTTDRELLPVGNVRYHTLLGLLAGTAAGNSVFRVVALPNYTNPHGNRWSLRWSVRPISDTPREPHVYVRWTLKPDQEKPNLDVIWTPPKGTKVKAGDKITAKLTARDDATTAQTGIARLRVDIGVGGGLVAAPAQYSSPVPLQECGRENPVRTYEATYTVPADPPPVIKLRANARDFAGNETWDDAEFPTSDWHGTISISYTWDEEGANGVITSTANLRLRETREQPITDLKGRVIGSKTTLVHTASSISENYAGVAGTAGGNPGVACEGSGPAELSGEAGTIWLNSSGRDATGVVGFSFPAEGTYFIDLNTAVGSQRYRVRCANGATHESAFTAPPIGMGVQEDPGRKIEDRGARMRGSYRGNWNAGQIQVTWDLFK